VDSAVICDNDEDKREQVYNAHDDDSVTSQQIFIFCSYLAEQ